MKISTTGIIMDAAEIDKLRVNKFEKTPEIYPLKTHNHLISNTEALGNAWETDGYWFFKNVLDKEAVARLRGKYVDELEDLGFVYSDSNQPSKNSVRYNGASLDNFPRSMQPLQPKRLWIPFVQEKPINGFFTHLLGEEPFWLPIIEYRAVPPEKRASGTSRIGGLHQDAPFSSVPYRICWIPLTDIEPDMGGLALAEGRSEPINRHVNASGEFTYEIPLSALPEDCWRSGPYEAGDLLMLNYWTPHTPLANDSEFFRLSIDVRLEPDADKRPVLGKIVSITPEQVTVHGHHHGYRY